MKNISKVSIPVIVGILALMSNSAYADATTCITSPYDNLEDINAESPTGTALALTATWDANDYTITYTPGPGATGTNVTQTVTFDTQFTTSNGSDNASFSRPNATLTGWNNQKYPNLGTSYKYTTADNLTLTGVWACNTGYTDSNNVCIANDHTLNLLNRRNAGGDSTLIVKTDADLSANSGIAIASSKLPGNANGFHFNGYYVIDATQSGSNFPASGTTTGSTANVCTGTEIIRATGGWSTENFIGTTPQTFGILDTTLNAYACWEPNSYILKFDANNTGYSASTATGVPSQRSLKHLTDTYPTTVGTPTRNGYTFAGWYDKGTTSGTKYYNANGTSAGGIGCKTMGSPNNINNDPGQGIAIDGYCTSKAAAGETGKYDVIGDQTLYAHWTPITYTITYSGDGTSSLCPGDTGYCQYTIEDIVTLPTPAARTGYTFAGWYDNQNFTGNKLTQIPQGSTGTKTFYAKWTANSFRANLNANGGSIIGDTTSLDCTYGTECTLPSISRSGYSFSGWTCEAEGQE